MAGAVDSYNQQGYLVLINNTFAKNVALRISNIMGSGSVIKLSGTSKTTVTSINNRYISNWAKSRG
jgi:hypothetical protein